MIRVSIRSPYSRSGDGSFSGWMSPGARLIVTVSQRSAAAGSSGRACERRMTTTAPAVSPAAAAASVFQGVISYALPALPVPFPYAPMSAGTRRVTLRVRYDLVGSPPLLLGAWATRRAWAS
jgi:hypothetical protein